ncbi:DUF4064 domain-containing protein [Nocardioides sp. SYSU D00065]|uniref:DUF4064 domain-containing protein n=1 Tax=Nocardioides sp. SYSU D00065 TaxID=2817378 RepID=UPI001B3368EE|nr:DUF4064 domain-containing protein [Nocardioides sp. SYSU D00065]
MSDQEPGPTHTPYGQPESSGSSPYGQGGAYGQQPSYGQSPYGHQPANASQPTGRRPGTVTAAAWIAIVFSALTALLFGLIALALVVARDQIIAEMERTPEFQDLDYDIDQAYGVTVAILFGVVVWSVIAIVLAVFVLRRSGVARILLVISSAAAALLSLLGIASAITAVTLLAALATIVLLFVGGAGAWFKGSDAGSGGYPGGSSGYQPEQYGSPYGSPYGGQQGGTTYPSSGDPYGQQQPPADGGSEYPPREYPGR